MSVNAIDEIIDTFTELKRVHNLNIELLEQLDVACSWLLSQNSYLPNAEKLYALLAKTKAVLTEIQSDEPRTLQYKKITDETLHDPTNSHELDSTIVQRLKSCWRDLRLNSVMMKLVKSGFYGWQIKPRLEPYLAPLSARVNPSKK